jgi:Saf4/Yju2 protein
MSERKVLSKYYPPEFDPSKITRTPRHLRPTGPKIITVRLMAPFSMKCTACGEYIYKGRKFNARKETTDEKYLKIQIFRFYIRCTRCSAEITFKTDPKNMDYTCERGAKRNTEPWRDTAKMEEVNETDEERLDRLEREEAEENELQERNAMEELEQRMMDSKREVQVADALDEIRVRNARIERGERGGKEEVALASVKDTMEEERLRAEREDEEAARRAFAEAKAQQEQLDQRIEINEEPIASMPDSMSMPPPPPPTFERKKIVKKPVTPGLVKVKKAEPQPTVPAPSLGLADYGSDSD